MKRRIKSGLLALAILLSLCSPLGGPVQQARAAETETETETTSGTWGENLSWELSGTTLTITGTGDMKEGEDVPIPVSLSDDDDYDPSIQNKNLVYPWSNADFNTVVIGEGVTSIAPKAFSGYNYSDSDTAVTFTISLPDSLKSIGDYAFDRRGDVVIAPVTLPSGLTSFGYFVFGGAMVKGIQVAGGNTAFSAMNDVLFNYDQTTLILYSAPITSSATTYTVPDTVKTIRSFAFEGCELSSVTVSEGVTSIGEGAFYDCTALESITLPDSVTEIGESAFAYSGLTSLTLPDSLTTVADGLCYCCSRLESVSFPEGITSIGDDAFYGCGKLQKATLLTGVTSIGDYAFYQCTAMKTVLLCDGLTSIGNYAFSYCYALTVRELPDGVTTIGDGAFAHCTALATINIPNSVTTIGDYAFAHCTALATINIPDGVTTIGDSAFYKCTALTAIQLPSSMSSIGDYAFAYCTALTTINIPAGLKTISESIFSYCKALKAVDIPAGVTSVENCAFMNCTNLTEVKMSAGVTKIGSRAFMNCSNLTAVDIPDGVTTIGGAAFAGCQSLTAVQLPDSVTTITRDFGVQGYGAFYYCIKLKEINIPAGLKTIPDGTFQLCKVLTEIVIPEGVTTIGEYAFDGCEKLRDLTIPKTVTTVGKDAFADCTALGYVCYGDTRAKWDEITIEDGNKDLTNALITCTDGYYGVEDPDLPGDHNYPKIQKVECTINHHEGGSFSYENLLPLYTVNQTTTVKLSLENSWFNDHLVLMGYDANGDIERFTGTIRIYGYSGTAFKVLYEKQGTAVYADKDASQLVFQMEPSEYTKPFKADQLLFVEVLDKEGTILAYTTCRSLPIQRWSFKNYHATIDEDTIKDILGDLKGTIFILANKETPAGSDGLCFGMAVTASLFNSGELFPTMFPNCTVLDQVQKNTNILSMFGASTAQELIQEMQVVQYTDVVQDEMEQNYGDIDGLIQAIDNYKSGKSAMPMVSLKGKESTHSICAYDYYTDDDNIAYFSCYDNCFPYKDCQLLIRLSTRSWELIGYAEDGYSGNSSTITYIVPSGFSGTNGKALMSAKSLGTLGTSGVKLVHIHRISNASDTDTTDTDTDTGMYWISGSGSVSATDLAGETMSIADDYAIYTINSASAGDFALADGEVGTMTATGDNVSLSCEYYTQNEAGESTLVRVTFDGASAGGSVSLTCQPESGTVALTGAGAGTVTVVYDDEDDTTDDPTWTQTVTGGEPTTRITVSSGCQYDAATHTVTLNTIPQGTESILIAAYAGGQLLSVTSGAQGRTPLNTAARRADEIRIFYLDGDQCPAAESNRIKMPQS